MKSKFYELYNLIMEEIKNGYDFKQIKDQALKEAQKFGNTLKENPILNDVLNLSSENDLKDFLNDTYRNIIKGSRKKFEGDIREMSSNLKIEDNKGLGLDEVTERSIKFKKYKKLHPDATIEDYKISIIRSNTSKLDDIAKLYQPEFKQLMEIYSNRDKLGISLDELKNQDIVETIFQKYKDMDLSKDFILKLFNFNNIKKNGANIGAGEFLICLFVKGSEWPVDNCDVAISGKKYEIKGSEAKVGETNSPIDILNETIQKIKQDFINSKFVDDPIKKLNEYKCFSKEAVSNTEYRRIFNFKTGSGNIFDENGIIGIIRNLYDYNSGSTEEKIKINEKILTYLNYFYPKNILGESLNEFFTLSDVMSNNYEILQNKFYIRILNNYKEHLQFDGLIFIGKDHVLHLFSGAGEQLLKEMLPFINTLSPIFGSLEKQNFHNRIIMKK